MQLVVKGAVEPTPLFSHGFLHPDVCGKEGIRRLKADSCSKRPQQVLKSNFKMETVKSLLSPIRKGVWLFSIDLKDVYLQILLHPESRHLLRFLWGRQV